MYVDENRDRHEVWERAHEAGSPTHRLRRSLVLSRVRRLTGSSGSPLTGSSRLCLDAGCGTGEFSVELARLGWSVVGFDPSPYAIDLARRRALQSGVAADFRVGEAGDLDDAEDFELILAIDVLEHIEDDREALGALAGRLAKGGRILVSVPADPALWSGADEFSGHFRRYTFESIRELSANAGLQVQELISYGYPVTRALWRLKKQAPGAERWLISEQDRSALRKWAATLACAVAAGVTSVDRLFPRSAKGVGLVAVLAKE
ncbi:MAG: class I SAM-dependent methyltransferase [Actinobacteria bacterium]|nr:MAG: class I SAM-dependent methyltransferase [Actinomycetota bacterium]